MKKKLVLLILVTFFLNTIGPPYVVAQGLTTDPSVLNLPAPGTMVQKSVEFYPPVLKGIIVNSEEQLKLEFILDHGEDVLSDEELEKETSKLIKYFLTALTIPEDELWVNLSPYEQERIIPENFGMTDMGRDLLAQDYLLKQLTASMIYPEDELGETFWKRVYAKAYARYGMTDIPVNTFNKVWIMPDKAIVHEFANKALVVKSGLKVMLEEDYLSLKENSFNKDLDTDQLKYHQIAQLSEVSSEVVRTVILPEIEKEVNHGKNFAVLRQAYHSLILAAWFKRRLKKSVLGQIYMDQNKVKGIDLEDAEYKEQIYEQYIAAFRKGVFDYVREDYDSKADQMIPRKYFSGGITSGHLATDPDAMEIVQDEGIPRRDVLRGFGFGLLSVIGAQLKSAGQVAQGAASAVSGRGRKSSAQETSLHPLRQNLPLQRVFILGHRHRSSSVWDELVRDFIPLGEKYARASSKNEKNKITEEAEAYLKTLFDENQDVIVPHRENIIKIRELMSGSNRYKKIGLELSPEELKSSLASLFSMRGPIRAMFDRLGVQDSRKKEDDFLLLLYGPALYMLEQKDSSIQQDQLIGLDSERLKEKAFRRLEEEADPLLKKLRKYKDRYPFKYENFIETVAGFGGYEQPSQETKLAIAEDLTRGNSEDTENAMAYINKMIVILKTIATERDQYVANQLKEAKEDIIFVFGSAHEGGIHDLLDNMDGISVTRRSSMDYRPGKDLYINYYRNKENKFSKKFAWSARNGKAWTNEETTLAAERVLGELTYSSRSRIMDKIIYGIYDAVKHDTDLNKTIEQVIPEFLSERLEGYSGDSVQVRMFRSDVKGQVIGLMLFQAWAAAFEEVQKEKMGVADPLLAQKFVASVAMGYWEVQLSHTNLLEISMKHNRLVLLNRSNKGKRWRDRITKTDQKLGYESWYSKTIKEARELDEFWAKLFSSEQFLREGITRILLNRGSSRENIDQTLNALVAEVQQIRLAGWLPSIEKFEKWLMDAYDEIFDKVASGQRSQLDTFGKAVPAGTTSVAGIVGATNSGNDPGGIDLNPSTLNMQIKGQGADFDLEINPAQIKDFQIDGLLPEILYIHPIAIQDLPFILGGESLQ